MSIFSHPHPPCCTHSAALPHRRECAAADYRRIYNISLFFLFPFLPTFFPSLLLLCSFPTPPIQPTDTGLKLHGRSSSRIHPAHIRLFFLLTSAMKTLSANVRVLERCHMNVVSPEKSSQHTHIDSIEHCFTPVRLNLHQPTTTTTPTTNHRTPTRNNTACRSALCRQF